MRYIEAEFIQTVQRTPTVKSFRFSPGKDMAFSPGQFLRIIFNPENTEDREFNKYLSFSCAPGKDYIEVTKRISRSSFSGCLLKLKKGDMVRLQGPFGRCVLKKEYRKVGFLIGGIGITPVVSMWEYIAARDPGVPVTLVYSNRNDKEIAFARELNSWKGINRDSKIVYVVTDSSSGNRDAVYGRINKDLIRVSMPDFAEREIFIFGPPAMVSSMAGMCGEIGCAGNKIHEEGFQGY